MLRFRESAEQHAKCSAVAQWSVAALLWLLVINPALAEPPVISRISPRPVSPGAWMYIEGANFDDVVAVRIGDLDARFAVSSMGGAPMETLSVIVPWEAVSGPVTVKSPTGSTTTPDSLEVVTRPGPVITKISPASSLPGGDIAIEGSNLIDVISVTFNGVLAGPGASMMDFVYFVEVPANATTGPITITTRTGSFTTPEPYVINASPSLPLAVSSVSPVSGPPGSTVVLRGSNFVNIVSVKFNGVDTRWSGPDQTLLFTTVPAGATTGPITITTLYDTLTTSEVFTVEPYPPPAFRSFHPESGETGAEITLEGRYLARATEIQFNGVPARFFVPHPETFHELSQVVAIVPTNATTGPITVVTPEGSVVSSDTFLVLAGPQVFGFDLQSAPPGAEVQLLGSGLDTVEWVMLGDLSAAFAQTATGLRFTVPEGAQSGPLRIKTGTGRVIETGMFYVQTPADPLADWASHGRLSESLASIAYGNGVFIAVGTQSSHPGILRSRDGAAWTVRPAPEGGTWHGVAFGEDLFVVAGDSGRILTSPDGIAWTRRTSEVSTRLFKAAWGEAGFVVVGESGVVLRSADGITWEKGVSGTEEDLSYVAAGSGVYVAGGNSSTLIVSNDGLAWRPAILDRRYAFLSGLAFAGGLFVGAGNGFTMTSTDGEHWTRRDLSEDNFVFLRSLGCGNGKFIAFSNYQGTMLTSTNGVDWLPGAIPTTQTILGLAFGQDRFVAGGLQGAILTSPDGETWRREGAGNPAWLSRIAFGNGRFVAVGGATYDHEPKGRSVLVSEQGGNWAESDPLAGAFRDSPLGAVTFDGERFVAVTGGTNASAQLSVDGTQWLAQAAPIGSFDIAYGNGLYVSVGREPDPTKSWWPPSAIIYRGVIAISLDGWDWTRLTFPSSLPSLRGVVHNGETWIAVGDDVVLRSANGVEWEQAAAGNLGRLNAVTYGGGKFVAVGGDLYAAVLVSPDGSTWESALPPQTAVELHEVAHGGAGFVAVGASGAILTSPDGLAWTGRLSGTAGTLSGVAFGNGVYVIVGGAGVILRSAPVPQPVSFASIKAAPATLELGLGDECPLNFIIETSTNLIDWVPIPGVAEPKSGVISLETEPGKAPACFYRAVLVN